MITRKRIVTAYGYYLEVFDTTGVTSYDDVPEGVLLHCIAQGGQEAPFELYAGSKDR